MVLPAELAVNVTVGSELQVRGKRATDFRGHGAGFEGSLGEGAVLLGVCSQAMSVHASMNQLLEPMQQARFGLEGSTNGTSRAQNPAQFRACLGLEDDRKQSIEWNPWETESRAGRAAGHLRINWQLETSLPEGKEKQKRRSQGAKKSGARELLKIFH